jgi:adenine-specific DNA-methyltransferase
VLTGFGSTKTGNDQVKAILGHGKFTTCKPVELSMALIDYLCPPEGLVMDAFAGTGTTGHAVLQLNTDKKHTRRFVLVESGATDNVYTDYITAERVRRVINGNWSSNPASPKCPGNFAYLKKGQAIDRQAILTARRDDLADIILTAHDNSVALDDVSSKPKYVIGHDSQKRAIALVWDPAKGEDSSIFTTEVYREVLAEVKSLGLQKPPYVYAAVNATANGGGYDFREIPDKILAALGILNLRDDT